MFMVEGYGLGMSYHDVMEVEVPAKDRLFTMLCDKFDEIKQALPGGDS